ncbi:hypothetical protein ACHQM5_016911 [Ranunculus cassubicifolius]
MEHGICQRKHGYKIMPCLVHLDWVSLFLFIAPFETWIYVLFCESLLGSSTISAAQVTGKHMVAPFWEKLSND